MYQNVRKANLDSESLEKNIGTAFQQVLTGSAELAAFQTERWEVNHLMATEMQGSLQSMKDREIGSVLAALASMQGQIVCRSNRLCDCSYSY